MASISSGEPPIHRGGGGPAMGSRLHGNDGPAAAHPTIVIPTTAGIHGGGAGDGFPSPRERRAGGGAPHDRHSHNSGNPRPHIVIPATAGIHGGGRRWVPVSTGTTGGAGHPTAAGIHGPTSSFPRRRESTGGGRRWVPVSTGTTGGGRAPHNRHSRDGGNPRRGAGDGFPSPRERRAGGGAPHNRHSRDGGAAVTLEPVLHPRLSRERRPLHNSPCGRQRGGDGQHS